MNKLLFLALVTAIAGVVVYWRPMAGLVIYAASVGLDYLLAVAGFSTAGLLSVGQVMLVLLLGVSCLRQGMKPLPIARPVLNLHYWTVLFVGAVWFSTAFALDPAVAWRPALVLTFTASIPFILQTLLRTRRSIETFVWALGLGATLSAGIGVLQFTGQLAVVTTTDVATADDTRGRSASYETESGREEGARFAGPTRNPNGFAAVLMGGMPALYYLALSRRNAFARVLAAAALAICGFALLLTMSRTYILLFMVFLGIFSYLGWRSGRIRGWVVAAGGILAIGLFVMAIGKLAGVADRIRAGAYDNSASSRLGVMVGGLRAMAHHPILGIGLYNTSTAGFNETYNAAHDIVSGLGGELGLLAAAAWGGLIWQAFRLLSLVARPRPQQRTGLVEFGQFFKASLMVMLLTGVGAPTHMDRGFWVLIGLSAALYQVAAVPQPLARRRLAQLSNKSGRMSLPQVPQAARVGFR